MVKNHTNWLWRFKDMAYFRKNYVTYHYNISIIVKATLHYAIQLASKSQTS